MWITIYRQKIASPHFFLLKIIIIIKITWVNWQLVWPSTLPIAENGEVGITWDMTTHTVKVLKHDRVDITQVHKGKEMDTYWHSCAAGQYIIRTEEEKVEKYQELAFEIRRVHGASKVIIIPTVISALLSISKGAKTWFVRQNVPDLLGSVQLSTILGTAHLLRKLLRLQTTGSCWDTINITQ